MDALHDRDGVTVRADVVIAADDAAADQQSRDHNKDNYGGNDDQPAPRFRLWWSFLLQHNAFGWALPPVDGGGSARSGIRWGGVFVLARYRARQNRLGLSAVVAIDHVGDDDGDVVGSAPAQRQFDETVSALVDVGNLERFVDGLLADRIRQPVRAQQIAVALARFAHDEGGFDFVPRQRAHDQ